MGAAAGIVLFLVVMNAALPFVNGLGITNSQFAYSPALNVSAVQAGISCTQTNGQGAVTCNQDIGIIGQVLGAIVTFGNFVWTFVRAIAIIPLAIALPAYVMVTDFYAPLPVAALYNVVFWVLCMYYFWTLVSNRYQNEVP